MLVLLATVMAPVVFSQGQHAPPLVTATGEAEVKVAPDLADLQFEVEWRGPKLKETIAIQSEKMRRLIASLKAAGIEEGELRTSQLGINPVYQRDHEGRVETVGISFFQVSQSVQCTLRDIRKVADVTAQAIDAGANKVGQAQLRSSRRRKHMDDARQMAVRAAREKAVALAAELGAKVGKPYSIQESGYNFGAQQLSFNAVRNQDQAVGGEGSFEPGKISLTATVTVSFYLE